MRSRSRRACVSFSLSFVAFAGIAGAGPDVQPMLGAGTLGPSFEGGFTGLLIQVGDFNHDGNTDYLYRNNELSELLAMMGDGSGGLIQYGAIEMPLDESAIVAAQLDSDSEPEFVVREEGSGFSIKPGLNEPTVSVNEPGISYDSHFGSIGDAFVGLVRAGDLDSDGRDELVFNTSDDRLFIRRADTETAFEVAVPGLGEQNTLYEVADYDGDGDLDLLLFSQDTEHFFLVEGTGTLTLGPVREIMRAYPSIADDERPVFAQIDDNAAMDMVVVDTTNASFRIEYNFVVDAFSVQEIAADEIAIPLHVAGDLDGSGEPDLVVYRMNQYVYGVGSPIYYPAIIYDFATPSPTVGERIVGQPRSFNLYAVGNVYNDFPKPLVTSLDADEDGDDDIVWYGYGGTVNLGAWYIENRDGVQGLPQLGMDSYDINSDVIYTMPLDVDDDGYDEFVLSGETNLRILDMQDGTLGRVNASADSFMVCAPDLDGDGIPELVNGRESAQELRIFTRQPDGAYGGRIFADIEDRGPFYGLEVADFNNDGFDDVAAMEFNGGVSIFVGGVGPTLTRLVDITASNPSGIKPAVLDYNGDGLMDLALGGDGIVGVELFRNEGDGTFTPGPVIPIAFESGTPYWVTAGDLDLDGNTDLVVTDDDSQVGIVFLDGAGNPSHTQLIPAEYAVEVVIADFNDDGMPDIGIAERVVTGGRLGGAFVVPQLEPRQFGRPISLPVYGAQGVATSDLNLDGVPDLVAVSENELRMRTYFGVPTSSCPADLTGDGELNFFDVSQFLIEQVDYNNDGSFSFFDVSAFLIDFEAGCP
ncbi:MAG: FG-GAP repeat domain-containing protein [Phycisphaerales bacterium JB052]